MYTVLDKVVTISHGKAIIRGYEDTHDSQQAYQELIHYLQRSTKSIVETNDIISYIASDKLGDGTWKGKTQDFILNWLDKVRKYEKMVGLRDHFSYRVKRIMLENCVQNIADLRKVKAESDQHLARTGDELTFEQYKDLLISAAITYDQKFVKTR